mmetsp:Transcript_31657/g.104906  ORF Transcript_31657/g.104906 Transcript_31657/m.104906 type:complete len:634 (+) Transcript_31657:79-1980(+)
MLLCFRGSVVAGALLLHALSVATVGEAPFCTRQGGGGDRCDELAAGGGGAGEDTTSLLMSRVKGVRRAGGERRLHMDVNASSEQLDLYQSNYRGENGMWCVGINAVGYDLAARGGRNGAWIQPSKKALKYFRDQGSNCFRLPITWERLQSTLGDDFVDLIEGVDDTVNYITNELNAYVIIDPHNNDQGLQYNGQDVNLQQFVNLWKGITKQWGSNSKAIFGLYNEPRYGYADGKNGYFDPDSLDSDGQQIKTWFNWMQAAIDAVRNLGADNLILVPGLHWTGSRDWSGADWWGESIGGYPKGGNTRLAGLTDPKQRIAYDVHQYMDKKFTGEAVGCGGHAQSEWGGAGGDWGLGLTIDWAKRFKKKLIMTEIGSWPANDGSNSECKRLMGDFLKRMDDSGVFIGYQVWQFGCDGCMADQWTLKPYNLDWYRWDLYGGGCPNDGADCRSKKCCSDPSKTCHEKDQWWGECVTACTPGIHTDDAPEFRTPWSCIPLGPVSPPSPPSTPSPRPIPPPQQCSGGGQDCRNTKCCAVVGYTCYEKDQWWPECKTSCASGIHADDPPEYQIPWSCSPIGGTCSADGEDCRSTKCCTDPVKKCYQKDQYWASCLPSCPPGVHADEPPQYQTPWTCNELGR